MNQKLIKPRLLRPVLFFSAILMLMVIVGVVLGIKEKLSQNIRLIIKNDNIKNQIRIKSLNDTTNMSFKEFPKGVCYVPVSLDKRLINSDYEVFFYNDNHLYDSALIHKNYIREIETIVIDVREKKLKIGYIRGF